jgi:hypothetical protein
VLIPTVSKQRLGSDLSYPVGTETVSEHLAGAPQFGRLKLRFAKFFLDTYGYASLSFSPVAACLYRNLEPGLTGSQFAIDEGFYDETWEIHIWAVPRESRPKARTALLGGGLTSIRAWLSRPRSKTWRQGHKRFTILADLSTGEFKADEGPVWCGSAPPRKKPR